MGKFIKFWGPVILWCGIIFFFSHQPELKTPFGIWDFILRKIAHITEYLILALLTLRALKNYDLKYFKQIFLALVFSLLYATSDEIHQLYVLGRQGSATDVLIDSMGITFGILIFAYFSKKRYNKEN